MVVAASIRPRHAGWFFDIVYSCHPPSSRGVDGKWRVGVAKRRPAAQHHLADKYTLRPNRSSITAKTISFSDLTGATMKHLNAISDIAVRDAVDIYQTQMERLILRLVGDVDSETVAAFLEEARQRALDHVKEFNDTKHEARAHALAIAMLEKTFDRLSATA